jgi:hypothetical protein
MPTLRGYGSENRDRYTGRFLSNEERQYLIQLRAQQAAQRLIRDIQYSAGAAIEGQLYERLRAGLYTWSEVMYKNEADRSQLEEMHEKIATEVQQRVIRAYTASQQKGRRLPSYRWADKGKMRRFSNKQMLKALQSESFIEYDYKGVYFPNVKHMDNAAAQWYRLNFGTAPRAQINVDQPNMKFGQRETKTSVNFNSFKPSAAFMVPSSVDARGVWSGRFLSKSPVFGSSRSLLQGRRMSRIKAGYSGRFRGQYGPGRGALYLIPNGAMGSLGFEARMSKGIVGARFLDAGADYLNRNYGQELSKLLDTWRRSANSAGKRVAERKTVAVPDKNTWDTKVVSRQAAAQAAVRDLPQSYADAAKFATAEDFRAAGGDRFLLEEFRTGEVRTLLRQWNVSIDFFD